MKKATSIFILLFSALTILVGWGCAGPSEKTPHVKDGKEYGKVQGVFRHRWWNYYERGISFMEGAFYPQAISDLEAAIGQREKDQRMARTYGMHFVDYFPHRELGIVFLEVGNLERAKKEIELSLAQYPTAKARFYLDQIRKGRILKEGKLVAPPSIKLDATRLFCPESSRMKTMSPQSQFGACPYFWKARKSKSHLKRN
jgi:tetratricopeptide (TPR) repeat protein